MLRREFADSAKWVDEHPVLALFALWGGLASCLTIVDYVIKGHLLLGVAGAEKRFALYTLMSGTAVAVLAAALTVLSILVALPDRPRVQELRDADGWRLLQGTLLAAATFCLGSVLFSAVGLAVDTDPNDRVRWLEQLCFSTVVMAVVATALGGVAFAVLLRAVGNPSDPSLGRGTGPA